MALKELDVASVRGRRNCDHKVVNEGEDQALGNAWVEGGNINNKQQRRNGGALWCAYGDLREPLWGALEGEPTLSIGEEATYPRNDVSVSPFGP